MFKRFSSLLLACGAAVLAVTTFLQLLQPAEAADLIVNPGESIQAAIDTAAAGDTIIIQPGTYTESLTLNKPVSLTGVSSDTVTIYAEPNQRVISITGTSTDDLFVISNLTIAKGELVTSSGGIDISNTAGDDYMPISQTVIFPTATLTQTILIETLDDLLDEPTETLQFTLTNSPNGQLTTPATITVTIEDNDEVVEPPANFVYLPFIVKSD